jgi:3-hydroxymyristoyl/3-hydroxydecanoyl-(acyl carrier protein) dehydratase
MYADGKPIVEITDMALQFTGLTLAKLRDLWSGSAGGVPVVAGLSEAGYRPTGNPPLFGREHILEFATGKPSLAFGEPYRVFDSERFIARLPRPPYSFIDRITRIEGPPWKLQAGGVVEAAYDVPADAWYFAANRQASMPYAVLLEVPLQACGFFAAYMGSALTSTADLCFRNLGGKAVQHRQVTPQTGTLTATVKVTRVSTSAGMIIQNYEFTVRSAGQMVLEGDTYFGFFTRAALAQQVGIREASPHALGDRERESAQQFDYPPGHPFPDRQLRMLDRIDLYLPEGGPAGLGFIQGSKEVNPNEWFFAAHFYQDPVWPGSLGLEAFLQLLKVAAVERWGCSASCEFSTIALGKPHRWLYRGQVLPGNKQVSVQAVITAVDDNEQSLTADGFLSVDGLVIYQMNDFSLRLERGA